MKGTKIVYYGGGKWYEGEVNAEGQPDGIGTMTWPDGSRFEGQVNAEGQPNGIGTMTWPDGSRFQGEVNAKGQPNGFGVMTWPDGSHSKGEWQDGKKKTELLGHKPIGPMGWFSIVFAICTIIFIVTLKIEHDAVQEVQDTEDRRKGFHCLSAWDGSHREFVRLVKKRMNDPDSFEHVETRVTPVQNDGKHVITMQFRGRNAFGGIVKNTAIGSYWPNCSPVLDGIL